MTPEDAQQMHEFVNGDDEARKAMMFDAVMNLLTEAVAEGDPVFIKAYARLATEIWNGYEQTDNESESSGGDHA